MSTMNEQISAGVIGLGAMGAPMARHLAQAGLLNMVWNRTSGNCRSACRGNRCHSADSPQQLAAACNVILTCVSADQDLLDVVGQLLPGVTAGTVLIDTSTVSPATAVRACKQLADCRCRFCRCAGFRWRRGCEERQLICHGRW